MKSGSLDAGDLKIRLLFDGTHGVPVNQNTRVRDQDRSSAAPGGQASPATAGHPAWARVRVQGRCQEDAHRLIPVNPQDWHLLAFHAARAAEVCSSTRPGLLEWPAPLAGGVGLPPPQYEEPTVSWVESMLLGSS